MELLGELVNLIKKEHNGELSAAAALQRPFHTGETPKTRPLPVTVL